ncbi:MAG: hypothetical protein RMK99_06930 [Anaerolineales bacterium]|nr:hypothetical protein [Anaerolineales bacterium]
MSELVLHDPLASEVRRMAEIEGTTAEQIVAEAVRQYRAAARERKIRAEAEWWRNAAPELRARYAGQFVAVHERQVIDADPDQLQLYYRLRARYGDTPILLTPANEPEEIRIISTHQEAL